MTVAALTVGAVAPAVAVDDTPAPAQVAEQTGPQVYTGDLTPEQLGLVRAVGLDFEDIAAAPADSTGVARVEIVMNSVLADRLVAQGVPLTAKVAAGSQFRTFAVPEREVFRSWSEPGGLRDELVATTQANDRLTQLVTIGQSVQGQDILAVRLTRNADRVPQGARPAVLYSSAQHAREWITPEMTRRLLHHYLDNYGVDPEITRIVDTTELWFVLVANPDGYDYTFTEGNRLWRKNLADNNADGMISPGDGVDPNRNWPTRWGYDNEGSSPDPFSEVYRGPSPASEPETRALDGLMARIGFEFLVNYHSAAELLLYGTGWQVATPTPDDLIYEALVGDDADPAVPGYDPDIAAELYTTNGETTEHAHNARGTLAFTPEMSTCQTASAVDPDDAYDPADCLSVFNFPDSEVLVQAEFELNIPFALSVALSAQDPANPVSVVGRSAPDFDVDSFEVSYGSPQTVAVTAKRELRGLTARYSINGGRERFVFPRQWRGGERYGDEGDLYYAEYRAQIPRARPGDSVEVWFTGRRPGRDRTTVESEHFTYVVAEASRNDVLVVANEDYTGVNPVYSPALTAPLYAQAYVDSLATNGIDASVWDVTSQGVPHDLGVLDHFDAVIWYQGDNRLTQDPEDELTETFAFPPLSDLSVAEREQYLTLSMRDYLNDGGKLLVTGETAGYTGQLGGSLGGIYYGLDGAPEADCVVTEDFFSDCLLLADDFFQYYLGAFDRTDAGGPAGYAGTDTLAGLAGSLGSVLAASNPVDEAGSFTPTSDVLPVEEFPQFASRGVAEYVAAGPDPFEPIEGAQYAGATHVDDAYMRLTRTVDLSGVATGTPAQLQAQLSFDTEAGYDNVIVEARTAGGEDWTTLADLNGGTTTDVPAECEVGFLLEEHPFLANYLTAGDPCLPTGATGSWNAFTGSSGGWQQVAFDLSAYAGSQVEISITYVTDPGSGGVGVFVDDTRVVIDGVVTQAEGFESGLGAWSVPGAPASSPGNRNDFTVAASLVPSAQAAVATQDSVLLGFGLEQVTDDADRDALLGRVMAYLLD